MRYIIIETVTSKAIEQIYGFPLIGRELIDPQFYSNGHVRGFVEIRGPYPLVSTRRSITLPHEDVAEAVERPLDEVLAEAKERSLE